MAFETTHDNPPNSCDSQETWSFTTLSSEDELFMDEEEVSVAKNSNTTTGLHCQIPMGEVDDDVVMWKVGENEKECAEFFGPELEVTIVQFNPAAEKMEIGTQVEEPTYAHATYRPRSLIPVIATTVVCCVWNLASFVLMVYLFWKAQIDQENSMERKTPWELIGTLPLVAVGLLLALAVKVECGRIFSCRQHIRDSIESLAQMQQSRHGRTNVAGTGGTGEQPEETP